MFLHTFLLNMQLTWIVLSDKVDVKKRVAALTALSVLTTNHKCWNSWEIVLKCPLSSENQIKS